MALFSRQLDEKAAIKALSSIRKMEWTDVTTAQSSYAAAVYSGLILEELREVNKKLDALLEQRPRS